MWLRSGFLSLFLGTPVGILFVLFGIQHWVGWWGVVLFCTLPRVCPIYYSRHPWGLSVIHAIFQEVLHDVEIIETQRYKQFKDHCSGGCIMAWSPHGISPVSMCTNPHPRAVVAVASVLYNFPLFSVLANIFVGGIMPITKKSIYTGLKQGAHIQLSPGGIQEMNRAPNIYSRHRGFARIAFETNVPLVPVIVRNEHHRVHNLLPLSVSMWTYYMWGIPIILPYISSDTSGTHVQIIYDDPLYPSQYKSAEELHVAYYHRVYTLLAS